ncbi:MAG: hypothetical protein K1X89_02250 [Myxococcaceae bacterium]|nr:hypothetical protein [Myxococcaceae bacterium]
MFGALAVVSVAVLQVAPDAPLANDGFDPAAPLVALLSTQERPVAPQADEQLRAGMELVRLEASVEHFDTSGPAWSSYMRGVGYVFLPIGLLTAPYLANGQSPISSLVPSTLRSMPQVSGPLGTMHTAGWWVLGSSIAVLSVGVIAGVTGWVMKTLELGDLEDRLAVARLQWDLVKPPGVEVLAQRR